MKDYYKILGIHKKDSCKHIRDVYWHLHEKFDPEINKENGYAKEELTEIEEAFLCLSDNLKRNEYDYLYENEILDNRKPPSKYNFTATWKMGITLFIIGCIIGIFIPIVPAYIEGNQGFLIDTITVGIILILIMLPSLLATYRRSKYQPIIIIINILLIIAIMESLLSIVIWIGLLLIAFLKNSYKAGLVQPDEIKH